MPFYPRDQRGSELETFALKVAIVAAAAVTLVLLWLVRNVLVIVFIAACLAAGIAPAVYRVRLFGRHFLKRKIPRGAAVLIVYFPVVIGVFLLAFIMIPRLIAETRALGDQLPMLIEQNILTPLGHYLPMDGVRNYLKGGVVLRRDTVVDLARNFATVGASLVAVLFLIVYMLIDAQRLRNLILLLYPADVRGDRRRMLNRIGQRMSSWLSGQLILSGIIGVATFITLLALRIPYALPLALLATIGEMVPVIGPILGATPALAIALLHSRWQFWSVLLMAILLQKAENLFIAPRVMAHKLSISPLAVFIAFMMGASVLGIPGAIMAIPIAAIAQVTFEEMFVTRRERRQDVVRAGTLIKKG